MGFLDYLIIVIVAHCMLKAIRFLRKNGSGCGGCSGDCMNCSKKNK